MLDLYKSAVRDSLDSGMISRREVHRLDALRHQLHISDADHELAMSELADEGGGLAASQARPASPEKQLQLETYAEALAVHLERQHQTPADVDNAFVRELRARYGVTVDEHAAVVERLLQSDGLASHLTGVPAAIEWLAATVRRFERDGLSRPAVLRAPAAPPLGPRRRRSRAHAGRRRHGGRGAARRAVVRRGR